jgi:hypothetical protein
LQLASSALGVKEGFTTAIPMATAIAILTSVNIILVFVFSAVSRPQSFDANCQAPGNPEA